MAMTLQLAAFNESMLVHYLAFFNITRILYTAFFTELMPREVTLTSIHLARNARNLNLFTIISVKQFAKL
jgi:hypothetical protein